jgi:predicted esterase
MRASRKPNDSSFPITRREALRRSALSAVAIAAGACGGGSTETTGGETNGRLNVRVSAPSRTTAPGLYQLSLGSSRDGLLYVPTSYKPETAAPISLLLHGAGRAANELVTPMRGYADKVGLILLAVDSRGGTWDAIRTGVFFDDVQFIERAFAFAFDRVRVDPNRLRIAGFSDGGSYSLSLGLINGDIFTRVAAFSPGFIVDGPRHGKPKFFMTHGTRDTILPIDQTSRLIVPTLRQLGYDVQYSEFDDGHGVTEELLEQATAWLASA